MATSIKQAQARKQKQADDSSAFKIPASAKNQQSYRNFANTIRAPKTRANYDAAMRKFMQHAKISSYDDLLKGNVLLIESRITQFVTETTDVSNTTKAVYLTAIKHFYEMNRVSWAWKIIDKHLGEKVKSVEDRAYSIEEIRRLYSRPNERQKVIISLLASTGCRIDALPGIKRMHLQLIKDHGIYKIKIYAGTKQEYFTFTSQECAKDIDTYFEHRERLTGEQYNAEAPLIREMFGADDPLLRDRKPRPITDHALQNIVKNLVLKAGLRQQQHLTENMTKFRSALRQDVPLTHGFRKFVNTAMAKAQVYPIIKEMLLGHDLRLDNSYLRPSEEDLV